MQRILDPISFFLPKQYDYIVHETCIYELGPIMLLYIMILPVVCPHLKDNVT